MHVTQNNKLGYGNQVVIKTRDYRSFSLGLCKGCAFTKVVVPAKYPSSFSHRLSAAHLGGSNN